MTPTLAPTTTAPQILTRNLDQNGDPLRGHGLQNFAVDIEALGIILAERMQFYQGDWWLALSEGIPLFQQILGVPNTNQGVAMILRKQILSTIGVTGISAMSVQYNGTSRAYTFQAVVQTVFGDIALANAQQGPGTLDSGLTWAQLGGIRWSVYSGVRWQ
jgi:hypothetical protein